MEPQPSSASPQQNGDRTPLLGSYGASELYTGSDMSRYETNIRIGNGVVSPTPTKLMPGTKQLRAGAPSIQADDREGVIIRAYPWRWVELTIFFLNLGMTNTVWITFAPVADVMRCYYGVSLTWVNTTSTSFMITYVLFFLPCAWFLDRYGLRATTILASVTNALGAAVRVAGTGNII